MNAQYMKFLTIAVTAIVTLYVVRNYMPSLAEPIGLVAPVVAAA